MDQLSCNLVRTRQMRIIQMSLPFKFPLVDASYFHQQRYYICLVPLYIVALRAAYSSRYSLYYSSPEITAYPPIKLRNDDDARECVHVYARILIGLTLIKSPLKIVANLLRIKEARDSFGFTLKNLTDESISKGFDILLTLKLKLILMIVKQDIKIVSQNSFDLKI